MDLFYGIYISQIVSKNGKTIHSIKPEQFLTLDLQISNKKIATCMTVLMSLQIMNY